jgi:hypothetical protein
MRHGFGNEHEIQLLESTPDITTQPKRVAELTSLDQDVSPIDSPHR